MTDRTAELVLVTPKGALLGRLDPIPVATPWWNHAEAVVKAAAVHYGIDVTILRLLSGDSDTGRVTYLAETATPCAVARPWHGALDDHPLRHPYAKPGGPAADLAWADACLSAQGYTRTGPAIQVRTWNLSSLWRIPTTNETLWLKVVPPFFAHEGKVLNLLASHPVPHLIAHENGRMLLAEIAGEDFYDGATPEQLRHAISLLVEIQASFISRENELLALGLPDWRVPALAEAMADMFEKTRAELAAEDFATLQELHDHLPSLARDLDECGLPPTLVHGDFHSGNLRGTGLALTLLDWGDSGLSHPLLDETALLKNMPQAEAEPIRTYWHNEWRRMIPGCDPALASLLLKPLAAIHQAIIRQKFIDNIEPAEHFYHLSKRTGWLVKAAELYSGQKQ